jgi:hypothetical protein
VEIIAVDALFRRTHDIDWAYERNIMKVLKPDGTFLNVVRRVS